MNQLFFFLLLCLSAARAHAIVPKAAAAAAAVEERRDAAIDLSRPPRVITPEILAHVKEVAKARGGGEKTAAVSSFAKAHSELLSRVAALSDASAQGMNGERVGEDGGREMMRSVLEAAAAKEGKRDAGGAKTEATAAAAAAAAAPRRSFSGPSPTRPWTDACLSHRTGQRISGPLFFGFSDPTTQRAVASLYTPDELAAARRGEGGKRREGAAAAEAEAEVAEKGDDGNDKTALSASSLATERAALDFVARYGVGEATACVLAHTTALSGSRFRSADELEAWARGGKGGESSSEPFVVVDAAALEAGHGWPPRARALLDFLLGSEEFPASTRRWPVWRQRLAPRLVVAVCGLVLEAEKKERGGDEEEATAGVAAVAAAAAEAGVVAAADQEVEEKEKPRANRGKKRATAAGAAPRTTRNKA